MKQQPNTEKNTLTITVPPETLAAIRIAEGIPQLVDLVGTALTTWGAIGTTDPVTWAISTRSSPMLLISCPISCRT